MFLLPYRGSLSLYGFGMPLTSTGRRATAVDPAAAPTPADEAVWPDVASTDTTTTQNTTTTAAPAPTTAAPALVELASGETDEVALGEDDVLSVVIDACEAELDDALIDAETVVDSVTETKRYY